MKIYHFNEITSTNDYAKDLLENEECVVVTADYQTAGRGRNNKQWLGNKAENLYFSIGVRHSISPPMEMIVLYQSLGCIAVYNVISNLVPITQIKLKYPNDVYAMHDGMYKKLCGVLAEHSFSGSNCNKSVIGIGINVLQENFAEDMKNRPVSLAMLGSQIKTEDLAESLAKECFRLLRLHHIDLHAKWAELLDIIGKEITVIGKEGIWVGKELMDDGRFLVEKNGEELIIDNGDSIRYSFE